MTIETGDGETSAFRIEDVRMVSHLNGTKIVRLWLRDLLTHKDGDFQITFHDSQQAREAFNRIEMGLNLKS